jgi:hypothetical protein
MSRLGYTRFSTALVVRDAPIRFTAASAACAAVGAEATRRLTASTTHNRGLIVIGITIAAFLIPLVCLALWAYFTAPRRDLQERVASLEGGIETLRGQLHALVGHEWGDPDQFDPVYHELLADLREAGRKLEQAQATGRVWGFAARLDDTVWKKNRDVLGAHPWAKADRVYGPCAEAFGHIERLNNARSLRWFNQKVQETDDLDAALAAIGDAEVELMVAVSD